MGGGGQARGGGVGGEKVEKEIWKAETERRFAGDGGEVGGGAAGKAAGPTAGKQKDGWR